MPDQSHDDPAPSAGVYNVANALTALRIALVPVFVWLLLREGGVDDGSRLAALVVFAVAMATDRIDGDIARKRGLVTEVGKIADPIADKALTGAAFVGLSVLGELSWWVTAVVLVRELGITLMRFAVIRYGVIPASRGGKVKTALQGLALCLYILPLPDALGLLQHSAMALAVIVTVATGVDYVASVIRRPRGGASVSGGAS